MINNRYEFLDRKTIRIHRDQESELTPGALEDVSRFQARVYGIFDMNTLEIAVKERQSVAKSFLA